MESFDISEDGARILAFEKELCEKCGAAMVPVYVSLEGDREICFECLRCVSGGRLFLQPKGNTPAEVGLMFLVQFGHVFRELYHNGRFVPPGAVEEVAEEKEGNASEGN